MLNSALVAILRIAHWPIAVFEQWSEKRQHFLLKSGLGLDAGKSEELFARAGIIDQFEVRFSETSVESLAAKNGARNRRGRSIPYPLGPRLSHVISHIASVFLPNSCRPPRMLVIE
jgi:hypothetical protein